MTNSLNDAGASNAFAVTNGAKTGRLSGLRRNALLGSSALVGIAMVASPVMAQTSVNPAGGGTVSFPNGTVTGGGAGQGVQVSGSTTGAVTVTNVNITQTTNSPTNNALDVSGSDVQFIGTNSLSTINSGGAAFNFTTSVNKAIDLTGSDNSFTGSYGLKVAAPGGFVVVNSTGHTQTVTGNGTAVAGFYVTSLVNPELYFGTSVVSGFATGAYMSQAFIGGGVTFVSTGGSISASSIGINADNGVGAAFINSQTAITAPTGISATVSTGATITTSGNGTIDSNSSGTGTGIFATSSSGTGNVVVTVGAAIGGTMPPAKGVVASTTGTSTGAINITTTAAISATSRGIDVNQVSRANTGSIDIGADVTAGTGIYSFNGVYDITVASGATVTGTAALGGSGVGYGIFATNNPGTVTNSGTIRATGTGGIGVYLNGDGVITNNASGLISGATGVQLDNLGTLTNAGTVTGMAGVGLQNFGGTTTNTGSITGTTDGIRNTANVFNLNNTGGSITGGANGVYVTGGILRLANTGTIQTTGGIAGAGLAGVRLASTLTVQNQTITNSGTISGGSDATHGYGIDVEDGIAVITNQSGGLITGGTGAIRLANANASTVTLNSGSTVMGDILSTNTGTRTLTVAGLLSGNYNAATGTGATTFTLNTGGSIQSVSMGNTAGTFTWNGGTVGGTLTGGTNLSTLNFNIGAGNTASLASITRFFGNVNSGTLILNGQTGVNGAWNVGATGVLRIGSSITVSSASTWAQLTTAGGKILIDNGVTLSLPGTGINAAAGNAGNPVNVTNNGTFISSTASGGSPGFVYYGINNNGGAYLTVNNTGSILTGNFDFTAAVSNAATTIVTNSGTIQGGTTGSTLATYGARSSAGTLTLNNTTISSVIAGGAQGVLTTGGALNITNSGFIVGTGDAISAAGSATITNNSTGTISTGTVTGAGIFTAGGTGSAIVLGGSGTITNAGTISSAAAAIRQTSTAGTLNLVNTGTIAQANYAFVDPADTIVADGVATILNSGTISTPDFYAVVMNRGGVLTNAAGGSIMAGSAGSRYGVVIGGTGTSATINNYGTISGADGLGILGGGTPVTINLHAGSTTGDIQLGNANDTLALYNGRGSASTATVDAVSGITLQNAGTLAGASVGSIDLGLGTNTLTLRGTGDGTAANGAAGTIASASVAGLTNLSKLDSGMWTLTGAGVYAGTTTVSGGTLRVFNTGNGLGDGNVSVASGATLQFDNQTGGQYAIKSTTFTGAGRLLFTGSAGSSTSFGNAGNVTVSLSQGGLIDVQSGTVAGSASGQGFFTGNLGSLNIASGAIFDGVEGTIIVDGLTGAGLLRGGFFGSGSTTIGIANGSATFTGTIADSTNFPSPLVLNKVGTGTQTLTGSLTYTGGTTISGGTLRVQNTTIATGTTQINSGATLNLANTNAATLSPTVLIGASTLTGTGTLVKSGTGSTSFGGSGNVNISLSQGALIDIQAGYLAGSSSFQGIWTNNRASLNIASGATFNGVEGTIFVDALTGSGSLLGGQGGVARTTTVGIANGSGTFAGTIGDFIADPGSTLALTKAGTGTQTLTGANSYTGATTISGGTLAIGGTGTLGSSTITNNATFSIAGHTGGLSVLNLLGSGTTTLGANTLTLTNASGTYSGAINGTGGLTKQGAGTYILSGTNAYTGTTTISGGTLQGTTNSFVGSTIVDNATLAYNQAFSGTVAQNISGSGRVTVTGLGANTLTFAGNLTNGGVDVIGTSKVAFSGASSTTGVAVSVSAANATVSVLDNASLMSGGSATIFSNALDTTVSNLGAVASTSDIAVNLSQGGTFNNGSVTDSVASATGGFIGFASGSPLATLNNYGAIRGTGLDGINAPTLNLSNFATGIVTGARFGVGGSALTVSNAGLIVGSGSGVSASSTVAITNSGLIGAGTLSGATQASYTVGGNAGIVASNGGTITNLNGGTISGGTASIQLTGTGYIVNLNAGSTTTGNLVAASTTGTNSYTLGGTLTGGLTAGSGNDMVTLLTSGNFTGQLNGGAGIDAFILDGTGTSSLNLGGITGFESLTKNGTGTFTLSGTANGATGWTINAGTLNASGGDALADLGRVTVNAAGTLGILGDETIGSLAGSGAVVLNANLTLGGDDTSSTFAGIASGSGGIAKTGAGVFTLAGGNTFLGDVTVLAGTLAYGADDVLADTVTVTVDSGATFDLDGYSDTIGTLNLFGTLANGGLLTATNYNAYTGSIIGQAITSGTLNVFGDTALNAATTATPVNINAGTLTTGSADLLSDTGSVLIASGAQLTLGGAETIGSLADLNGAGGIVELGGFVLTVGGDDATTTFSGVIQSLAVGGGLTKTGTGNFTLAGVNSYAGTTTIDDGTLALDGGNAIADTGAVLINTGGTLALLASETVGSIAGSGALALGGFSLTTGADDSNTSFAGIASGTGGLTKIGTGTLTLTGINAYSGDTLVAGGTLALSQSGSIAASRVIANGIFDVSGVGSAVVGTSTLNKLDQAYGSFSGSTTPIGPNQLNFMAAVYGVNAVIGFTDASGLIINLLRTNNDIVDFYNVASGDPLIGTMCIAGASTACLTATGGVQDLIPAITTLNGGSGLFSTGQSAFTAMIGDLLGGSGIANIQSLAGTGAVVLGSTTLVLNNASDDFAGVISGAGGLTLTAGAQTLSGDNSYTGTTTVNGGTLTLTGTNAGLNAILINGGVLSVASAANLGATGSIGLLGGTLTTTASFTTDRTLFTSMATPGGRIDIASGTTFGVNGTLSGDGALEKTGLGTLNLLADNSGFSGDLFVNGGAVRAGNSQAFGTGTIHLVDPTLIFGATGTYANAILLDVQTPASADPATLRAESGVTATISGSITQGSGIGVDANQPLVIGGLGRIILSNTSNLWAGTTTVNVGATLQGTTGTISGSNTIANGLLLLSQPISGTFTKNVSGTGNVQISGLNAGETLTLSGALTNNNGLQVLDSSGLAITGSVATTGNFSAVTLNLANLTGVTSQLNNSGAISGVFALNAITNLNLVNSGSIAASIANFNNSGIFAGGNATVVNSGQIMSGTNALYTQGTGNLTNSGLIRGGVAASTIRFFGANSSVNNLAAGVISTTGTGGGVLLDGINASVINAGSITGGNAIQLVAGGTVTNTGTLTSTVGSGVVLQATGSVDNRASGLIQGATNGVTFTAGSATIANAGTITGSNGAGLRLLGGGVVTNAATGQITGTGNAAILVQGGALNLVNQGSLTGTTGIAIVTTGAFNNLIDLQAGSITNGSVTTDTGADTLTLNLGARVTGSINGGAGTDSFIAAGAGSTTLASSISNYEMLTKNGSGTLTLSGANAGFATVTVNAGTLNASGGSAIDDLAAVTIASGATLGVLANETVGSLALAGTLAGTGTLTAARYDLTGALVNANLGTGTLNQVAGLSTLNGTAAATTVAIMGGTLVLGASDRLADAAIISVASGASLDLGSFNDTTGLLAVSGTLSGTGTLTVAQYQLSGATVNANLGTGTLFQLGGTSVLNGTAAATNVMVQGGTLTLGAANRLADAANVAVASGATLNLGGNLDTVGIVQLGGTLAGTGTLTAAQYQLTGTTVNANLGAGTLFQLGGTSTLAGTAAATTVMINGGTLALAGNERLADTAMVQIASGASFDLAGRTETIGSIGGLGTLALGNGRLAIGGTNADMGFGGTITGSGDVDKNGSGNFTLASNLAQTGRLNLNAGATQFTGSTAGSVRVQGGTLTGSAAIAGNLAISAGSFSPGSSAQPIAGFSAGSLTVSGGTLAFDLGGAANNFAVDQLRVTGAATLTGGTVLARTIDPSANYKLSQNYLLIQSGSLSGTFANGSSFAATGNNADLQWRLRSDLIPNSVVLELRKQIDFTTGLGTGATGNNVAVGAGLNGGAFMASDNWAGILNTINDQDGPTRRATYDSISGEAISDISSSTVIATNGFTDLLRLRLATGAVSGGDANLLAGLVGGKQALVALVASAPLDGAAPMAANALRADPADTDSTRRAGVWLQGFGANGTISGLNGQATLGTYSAGVAGGLDVRFGKVTIGGAFAVSQVENQVSSRVSRSTGTLYQGGGYAAYDDGRLYGSVIGSYFSGDINSRRSVFVGGSLFGEANGQAATRGYSAGGALGYRTPLGGGVVFTPQASITVTGVTRDAFSETGVGGLSLQVARDQRLIYTATGEAKLSKAFDALGGVIVPYIGGGASYSFGDLDTLSTNRFSGAPIGTGSFSIQGARLAPVTALVNAGLDVQPTSNVRLGLQGEARLSNRQQEQRISLNLRIGF